MQTYAVVTKHFGIIPGNVVGYVKLSTNLTGKVKVYNTSDTSAESKDWKWCSLSRKPAHIEKALEISSELCAFEDSSGYTCLCWKT